ncbi:MAG TPA: hypothetical protein VEB19_03160 [Gemmatimonadaceae bacterium]|nr:hypothetical protein [Gemmatimonadaceae bacterium]
MPITAKLSREFYERFGDKVVNEMVDLFNRIDDASRSDLRLLNEQNALRYESKLDQRTAELQAKLDQRTAELEAKIDKRTTELEAKIDQMNARIDTRFSDQEKKLEAALHAHTRWMIGMWALVIASQVGLWIRGS